MRRTATRPAAARRAAPAAALTALTGVLLLSGTGCGDQPVDASTSSTTGHGRSHSADPTTPGTATPNLSASTVHPVSAVPAAPTAAVTRALLRPSDLPDTYTQAPDPATESDDSHQRSSRPDCSAALAQLNSAAADDSALATAADRASAYFTTSTAQGGAVTVSHSVARYRNGGDAALAWSVINRLAADCDQWTETDNASQPTTLTLRITPAAVPDKTPEAVSRAVLVAFTVRLTATGGVTLDKHIDVAAARAGSNAETVELLARTSDTSKPAPPGATDPVTMLTATLARVPA